MRIPQSPKFTLAEIRALFPENPPVRLDPVCAHCKVVPAFPDFHWGESFCRPCARHLREREWKLEWEAKLVRWMERSWEANR